ncbi:MAG: ribosome maturation factor RimP [Candidatus Cloacimonetes bacterium]|nr:ribosome maturation factor RimP [Candidatus Cloacimonadota bacterium]
MIKRIEEIAQDACSTSGVALYDVEMKTAAKGLVIIVYITRINGVTVEDCRTVSKKISAVLDEEDLIESRYFLEVSSPGLERDLKLKKQYKSAINETTKISFHNDDGKTVTVIGILREVRPDEVVIEIHEELFDIPFSHIKKARTYFDYKKEEQI